MAKPWGRIELDYINHDKFKALNANAMCLWHEGKNYCDIRLTDGLIPMTTVKHFRWYSRKALAFLLVSAGPKTGTTEHYAPLWEAIEGFGYKMHDYLEHNDGRETVLARIAKSEATKQADVDRKAFARAVKEEKRIADEQRRASDRSDAGLPPGLPSEFRRTSDAVPVPVQAVTGSIQRQNHKQKREEDSLSPPADDPFLSPVTTERAGAFIRRYELLYREHRNGARYAPKPVKDYAAAVTLCATWADDARLDKLAVIFLKSDSKFAEEGSRTIGQFLALASWCDGKLCEWERTHPRPVEVVS